MRRNLLAIVLAVGAGLAAGCSGSGGGSDANSALDAGGKAALQDLGQALKSLADEGRRPPARPAEFESVEPMAPVAAPAVRNGEIVYVWGAGYASGSNLIVAYEKKAPTGGGFVLLQDGTVKEMTASEFQSAPKAKK